MNKTGIKIFAGIIAITSVFPVFAKDAEVTSKVESKLVRIKIKADKKIMGFAVANDNFHDTPDFREVNRKFEKSVDLTGILEKNPNKAYPIFIADTNEFVCEIIGLQPNNDYVFKYQLKDSKEFSEYKISIPAPAPLKQAFGLAFKPVNENTIPVIVNRGDGSGRVIIVKYGGGEVDEPKNGVEYKANGEYGVVENKIGESYVVFSGNGNQVDVKKLKSGKYAIKAFEYNGNGKNRTYNFEQTPGNPRIKSTMLPVPKVNEAKDISENGFAISWDKVDGADTYYVDVAYDANFKELAQYYKNADVGNTTNYEVVDLEKNKTYYFRVRAENVDSRSEYSKTLVIEPKK